MSGSVIRGSRAEALAVEFLVKRGYSKVTIVDKLHDIEAIKEGSKAYFEVKQCNRSLKPYMRCNQYKHLRRHKGSLIIIKNESCELVPTGDIRRKVRLVTDYKVIAVSTSAWLRFVKFKFAKRAAARKRFKNDDALGELLKRAGY